MKSTPSEAAAARGIEEIVHYTTQRGVFGAIAKGAILSRPRLDEDDWLEHIFSGIWDNNAKAELDNVHMSVGRINAYLLGRSKLQRPEMWWCVLSFGIDILDEPGVQFTTVNNIWPRRLKGSGVAGFEGMFADSVAGRFEDVHHRTNHSPAEPTHFSAEVLFPGQIALDRVQRVYVEKPEHAWSIRTHCNTFDRPSLDVRVQPDALR